MGIAIKDTAFEVAESSGSGVSSNNKTAELESKLKDQNVALWKVKDALKKHVSTAEMRLIVEASGQDSAGSKNSLRDRCDSSAVKKARVVWSVDLHKMFVNAVNQFGFDKVCPMKILDLMNVPGLTRENVAIHLQMELPQWTDIVKTGKFKELAPYDPDWYYTRAASMARKIYLRQGIGVGGFQKIYGGNQSNGSRPSHFCKSSGAVARSILHQLEAMNIVEKDTKGGRKITSQGRRDLDQVAGRVEAVLAYLLHGESRTEASYVRN